MTALMVLQGSAFEASYFCRIAERGPGQISDSSRANRVFQNLEKQRCHPAGG